MTGGRGRDSSGTLKGEKSEVTKYTKDGAASPAIPAIWTRFDLWFRKKKKRLKLEVERNQLVKCIETPGKSLGVSGSTR